MYKYNSTCNYQGETISSEQRQHFPMLHNMFHSCKCMSHIRRLKSLSLIGFVFIVATLSVCTYSLAFENDAYSVTVPENYRTDSESIDGYTSLYGDNVTVGIKTEYNQKGEDITSYTESKIEYIINDTIASLDSKASGSVTSPAHSITTFSDNKYPALFICYEGKGNDDTSIYLEEYIIPTSNHIFTIVFSAKNAADLDNDDVKTIKAGFTAKDVIIVHSEPTDDADDNILYIFIGLTAAILLIGALVVFRIVRSGKH